VRKQDKIFEEGNVSGLPFSFNQEVTEVFEDMIDRSVPGYNTTLRIIQQQAKNHCIDGSNVYDLGCSLGASTSSLLNALNGMSKVIAIDNSDSMIKSCIERFSEPIKVGQVNFLQEDISNSEILDASIVVINFVLQFLSIKERVELMKKIYQGLVPGGILILSEKIHFDSKKRTEEISNIHHSFKAANGYSKLEISSKRDSLEGVLVTETESQHLNRAKELGFKDSTKLMSNLNFLTYKFQK
jgi:tRNA (cmo5U34)-methyltransferase